MSFGGPRALASRNDDYICCVRTHQRHTLCYSIKGAMQFLHLPGESDPSNSRLPKQPGRPASEPAPCSKAARTAKHNLAPKAHGQVSAPATARFFCLTNCSNFEKSGTSEMERLRRHSGTFLQIPTKDTIIENP